MPELKRGFSQAKMNKDLDERLIQDGQYRDALNIQIATSDESNVGAAQTLLGNSIQNTMATLYDTANSTSANAYYGVPTTSMCVASIAKPDTDKIYYFVAAGHNVKIPTTVSIHGVPAEVYPQKDYILEYDTVTNKHKYVFVDIYRVKETAGHFSSNINNYLYISNGGSSTINKTGVRPGMVVHSGDGTWNGVTVGVKDNVIVETIEYDTAVGKWKIRLSQYGESYKPSSGVLSGDSVYFTAPRVLNFNWNSKITGVNILDDMLFWTDNLTEPKKINIKRSKAGTGGVSDIVTGGVGIFDGDTDYFHTRLVADSNNDGNLQVVTNTALTVPVYVEEKHITVIRKAPTQPLELNMSRSNAPRTTSTGTINPSYGYISDAVTTAGIGGAGASGQGDFYDGATIYDVGDEISLAFDGPVDFREGDVLLFSNASSASTTFPESEAKVKGIVTASNVTSPNQLYSSGFKIMISSIAPTLTAVDEDWTVRLKDKDPLFEFKFPRFSYRYKYQDGEYSNFAPWSQIAFLPGEDVFFYEPKKGYNLSMTNRLKGLILKGYYGNNDGHLPEDVVEIDILYKETNSPTVYVVKTLKSTDPHPVWPNFNSSSTNRGEFEVTTEVVHAVVPSNQLLRPWDNVPRVALAQEISANRLIYGNYLQNYSILKDPIINLSIKSNPKDNIDAEYAVPSVKSMRTYKVGVVFSDKYGRETPVLTNDKASIQVPKEMSVSRNRLVAKLGLNTEIPSWAEYYSWYIKETSTEYYTLAMDRWYPSADGNIWLSFPSSERNKLDEETFLILKKAHNRNTSVTGGSDNPKARYKILAIENDAPDYIKTEKKSLGTLVNSGGNVGNGTEGYPLEGSSFITIKPSAFEEIFGKDMITNQIDNLYLKLRGQGKVSEEYEISNLSQEDVGSRYKLKLKKPFGDDVEFTSTNNTFTTAISDLEVELLEHEVENRPEFDGRFFVKVFKDETLQENILSALNDESDVFITKSEKIYYINNNYHNQPLGWDSRQLDFTAAISSAGTSGTYNQSGKAHPTRHSNHASYDWGANDGSGARFGISDTNMDVAPQGFLNYNGQAQAFWEGVKNSQHFFIDAASCYSLTARQDSTDQVPGNGPSMNSYTPTEFTFTANFAAPTNSHANSAADGAANNITSNIKKDYGQPSRGIWGPDNTFMDLSWVGFGEGFNGGNWMTHKPYAHKLSESTVARHQNAWEFMQELSTPGTKFRFERDPDKIVYTVEAFGYNSEYYQPGVNPYDNSITTSSGVWGLRNFKTEVLNDAVNAATGHYEGDMKQFKEENMRQRWTIKVNPGIGSGPSGYNPIKGTHPNAPSGVATVPLNHDFTTYDTIQLVKSLSQDDPSKDNFSDNPAVWETEPKENVELDIYYQASGLIPLELNEATNEEYIPIGSTFKSKNSSGVKTTHTVTSISHGTITVDPVIPNNTTIALNEDIFFKKRNYYNFSVRSAEAVATGGSTTQATLKVHGGPNTPSWWLRNFRRYQVLDWNNCWCFGNGVESDRIRDDFNAPQIDNGVKASTTLAEPVTEERRKHGLIWSGIYNSQSGVNDLNQFIMAEKITKDINPVYGSIQKLYNRNTRLIMFCEDKVLRAVTNKDALYNADGKPQLVASNAVIGDVQAYQGDYGIATNPESFVATPYQMYFADYMRGHVLALSTEGVRSISNIGMKDYFSDIFKTYVNSVIGTYDEKKREYNITIGKKYHPLGVIQDYTTLSYSESAKGWTSFKSFHPESGVSLNNNYYTFKNGQMYIHHDDTSITSSASLATNNKTFSVVSIEGLTIGMLVSGVGIVDGSVITSIHTLYNSTYNGYLVAIDTEVESTFKTQVLTFSVPRNNFYGTQYESTFKVTFNDLPGSVKSFNAVNYEGTQAKITSSLNSSEDHENASLTITDAAGNTVNSAASDHGDYFNLEAKEGWYVDNITTNKQTGTVVEFKEKEGKWFGWVSGDATTVDNLDESEFSVQGLGTATFTHSSPNSDADPTQGSVKITIANNTSTSYVGDDASGTAWDVTAD